MRRILLVTGGVLLVAVVAVSWLGLLQVPVLSSVFGMDHARDLGVRSDPAAFQAFATKWGIERPSAPGNYTLSSKHHWSGSVHVDDTISEAALNARPEFHNSNTHFSGIQMRLHNGYAEIAAFVNNVQGYPISGPVYGQFSIAVTSPKSVRIQFGKLEFGRIGVPGNIVDSAQNMLSGYFTKAIVQAGVTIEALQLREGALYFKGTWPKTITADPPGSNTLP